MKMSMEERVQTFSGFGAMEMGRCFMIMEEDAAVKLFKKIPKVGFVTVDMRHSGNFIGYCFS